MNELLSVSEARKLTGKSESTIKRMIREITADEYHEDRGLIEPTHDELERRKAAKEPYVWKISKSLFEKRYPAHDSVHGSNHDTSHGGGESKPNDMVQSQLIELLQTQITGKDDQIKTLEAQLDRKDEQISNLNERTKEVHVLMQTLQKRLELTVPARDGPRAAKATLIPPADDSNGTEVSSKEKRTSLLERLNKPIRIFNPK